MTGPLLLLYIPHTKLLPKLLEPIKYTNFGENIVLESLLPNESRPYFHGNSDLIWFLNWNWTLSSSSPPLQPMDLCFLMVHCCSTPGAQWKTGCSNLACILRTPSHNTRVHPYTSTFQANAATLSCHQRTHNTGEKAGWSGRPVKPNIFSVKAGIRVTDENPKGSIIWLLKMWK